jgi:glycosyltransferase involved in cell wall biosynthesis
LIVSFGIPAYDSPYFEQTLHSVLAQTLSDLEVIVSDDGRREATRAIVARTADPRVRYLLPDGEPGVPANWNRCLRQASGTYFVLLPDDDLIAPEFAERMVRALETHPSTAFAQCSFQSVDAELRILDDAVVRPPADVMRGLPALTWQLDTLKCNPAALMFRREALVCLGGWEERYWDDWALTLRLAFRHGFVHVPEPLARVRRHATNLSSIVMRNGRDEVLDIVNQQTAVFGDAMPVTDELLALRARWIREASHRAVIKMVKHALRGDFRASLFHCRRARHLYPLAPLHPGFLRIALTNKIDTYRHWRRRRQSPHAPIPR